MKIEIYTRNLSIIGVYGVQEISFKRQENKEYTINAKVVVPKSFDWGKSFFVSFLDDNKDKNKRIKYNPSGIIKTINDDNSISVDSLEVYIKNITKIPDNWGWWIGKRIHNVVKDHIYGFRTKRYTTISDLTNAIYSHHVKIMQLTDGNGEIFADTDYYFTPSNVNEVYYYHDGYIIYMIEIPDEARREGMVLRWKDATGGTTDISVQFFWNDSPYEWNGAYSNELSPVRGEGITPNESSGVDIPYSDKKYLYVRFNLKYDTGTISPGHPKGFNYSNEITTVEENGKNKVYYGTTAILKSFEVIYRTDTLVNIGEINLPENKLMYADIGATDLLESLKKLCEAYNLIFFFTFEQGKIKINCYDAFVNDLTDKLVVSDKLNLNASKLTIGTDYLQAVEAYGAGDGIDRIHAFVKQFDDEADISNIGIFEDSETYDIETLTKKAKDYIETQNSELSSVSFEFYERPLQIYDKIKIFINGKKYITRITEENYSENPEKIKKEYNVGIKTYPFRSLFGKLFDGDYLFKPDIPSAFYAKRIGDGWNLTWNGSSEKYVLQYRKDNGSVWNTLIVNSTSVTIGYTEYEKMYEFRLCAVGKNGLLSDFIVARSDSLENQIYTFTTYHDSFDIPKKPIGKGDTNDWHRSLTATSMWESKKESKTVDTGEWQNPVETPARIALRVEKGEGADIPKKPDIYNAVAYRDNIELSCNVYSGTVITDTAKSYYFEISKDNGKTWVAINSTSNVAYYEFQRNIGEYPEISDLKSWLFRVRVINSYGKQGEVTEPKGIDTSKYGTWIPSEPQIKRRTSGRSINLDVVVNGNNKELYGTLEYHFLVQRYDDEDRWYFPNINADPYSSEFAYRGELNPLVWYSQNWNQFVMSFPFQGQDSNIPMDTVYRFRIKVSNEFRESDYIEIAATAAASSIKDLTAGSIGAAQLKPNSIDAEKLTILAKNKVNPFFIDTQENPVDLNNKSGWMGEFNVEKDDIYGYKAVIYSQANTIKSINSSNFEVFPNDILKFSFGLKAYKNYGVNYGIFIGLTYNQNFIPYRWNKQTKIWIKVSGFNPSYFISDFNSTEKRFFQTYIIGSAASITDVSAPSLYEGEIYMFQLTGIDTTCSITTGFNAHTEDRYFDFYIPQVLNVNSGKIIAEQIQVNSLSAISSYLGEVRGGGDNYKLVMGPGGSAPEGTFLLGSDKDDAYFRRYKKDGLWQIAIKFATFIVEGIKTRIKGEFKVERDVKNESKENLAFYVNPGVDANSSSTDVYGAFRVMESSTNPDKVFEALPNGNVVSATYRKKMAKVDLKALDPDLYYPVTFSLINEYGQAGGFCECFVHTTLAADNKPVWATHPSGFSVFFDILNISNGWGTQNSGSILLSDTYDFCNKSPVGYTQMGRASLGVFWLRGGASYLCYASNTKYFTIRTSEFTSNGDTVKPMPERVLDYGKRTIGANLISNTIDSNNIAVRKLNPDEINMASNGYSLTCKKIPTGLDINIKKNGRTLLETERIGNTMNFNLYGSVSAKKLRVTGTAGMTTSFVRKVTSLSFNLRDIVFKNGNGIAVGTDGVIYTNHTYTNTSLTVWEPVYLTSGDALNSVDYDGEKAIAVGNNGTIWVCTEPTLKIWVKKSIDYTTNLLSVSYNEGTAIAVGDDGLILVCTEPTLTTWVQRPLIAGNINKKVILRNGKAIIIGDVLGNSTLTPFVRVCTEPTLTTWSNVSLSNPAQLNGLYYDGEKAVIVGNNASVWSCTEPTLKNWVKRPMGDITGSLTDVFFNNMLYCISNIGMVYMISEDFSGSWYSNGQVEYLTNYKVICIRYTDNTIVVADVNGGMYAAEDWNMTPPTP